MEFDGGIRIRLFVTEVTENLQLPKTEFGQQLHVRLLCGQDLTRGMVGKLPRSFTAARNFFIRGSEKSEQ